MARAETVDEKTRPVRILSGGYILVIFPVNPNTLAKYRSAFKPSRAKDDPTDAEVALEILVHHRDKLTPLSPQSADMRVLRQLVESRRSLVVSARS